MSNQTRRYMSKRQRPCDFCRSRKTACRIELAPPCRLCILHGRECTFLEAAPPRKRNPSSVELIISHGGVGDQVMVTDSGGDNVHNQQQQQHGPRDLDTPSRLHVGDLRLSQFRDDPLPSQPPLPALSPAGTDGPIDFLRNLDFNMDSPDFRAMFQTPSRAASVVSIPREPTTTYQAPTLSAAQTSTAAAAAAAGAGPSMYHPPRPGPNPNPNPLGLPLGPDDPNQPSLLDRPGCPNPQFLGLSNDMDTHLLCRYRINDKGIYHFDKLTVHSVQTDHPAPEFVCLLSKDPLFDRRREEAGADLDHSTESALREELEALFSPDMGECLVRVFHRFITPQFPLFATFMPVDPASSPPGLLAALYAIALPFALYDDRLSVDIAYDNIPYAALSRIISHYLSRALHSPDLAVVQTLLLIVLKPSSDFMASDAPFRSTVMSRLVSCAVTLGLHLDPSCWSIPPWQAAHRRRLSFFVFAVDVWLASCSGRPPLISIDNWIVTALRTGDDLGSGLEGGVWDRVLDFSATTAVLHSVLVNLYSIRAIADLSQNPARIPILTTPLLAQTPWPSSLGDTASRMQNLSSLYVQLLILKAENRPTLNSWSQTPPSLPPTHISPNGRTGDTSSSTSRFKMRTCTSALADLVRALTPETDGGFWPPWCQFAFSSICFAQLAMAVSSPDEEEATSWLRDMHGTRKSLRLKVASFPMLRLGLLRIDAVCWQGLERLVHMEGHVVEAVKSVQGGGG